MEKGFNKQGFMAYLEKTINGFNQPYFRELVENLIEYGLKWHHFSKNQFCYWLEELLPEISFAEIAAFMADECLTGYGLEKKEEAIADFEIEVPEVE